MNTAECFQLIKSGPAQERLYEMFDSLEPVSPSYLIGLWKGCEIPSGHPMDGVLTLAPWYGKKFYDEENAAPLIMKDKTGKLYSANPDPLIRCATLLSLIPDLPKGINPHLFDPFIKLFRTTKNKARVRVIKHRGVYTAAMIYDHLEIIDVFRKIDDNTVLGVMDFKGRMHSKGYFFLLKRQKRIEDKSSDK